MTNSAVRHPSMLVVAAVLAANAAVGVKYIRDARAGTPPFDPPIDQVASVDPGTGIVKRPPDGPLPQTPNGPEKGGDTSERPAAPRTPVNVPPSQAKPHTTLRIPPPPVAPDSQTLPGNLIVLVIE